MPVYLRNKLQRKFLDHESSGFIDHLLGIQQNLGNPRLPVLVHPPDRFRDSLHRCERLYDDCQDFVAQVNGKKFWETNYDKDLKKTRRTLEILKKQMENCKGKVVKLEVKVECYKGKKMKSGRIYTILHVSSSSRILA